MGSTDSIHAARGLHSYTDDIVFLAVLGGEWFRLRQLNGVRHGQNEGADKAHEQRVLPRDGSAGGDLLFKKLLNTTI